MADPQKVFVELPDGRRGAIPRASLEAAVARGARIVQDEPQQPTQQPMQASMSGEAAPGVFSNALEATGKFMRSAGDVVNPAPVLDALSGSGQFRGKNPLQAVGQVGNSMLEAQGDQLTKARDAWGKGNYTDALRYGMGYLIPMLGPGINHAGDLIAQGKVAEGLGETAGLGLSVMAPAKMQQAGHVSVRPFIRPALNQAEAAAIAFADASGIPVDLAMRSGSKWVQNAKTLLQNTITGNGISRREQQKQTTAIGAESQRQADQVYGSAMSPEVAGDHVGLALKDRAAAETAAVATNATNLSDRVYPQPVSPQQAGETVRGGLQAEVMNRNTAAGQAYDIVRQAEADPANARSLQIGTARTLQAQADLDGLSMSLAGKPFDKLSPAYQQSILATAQSVGISVAPMPVMQTVPLPVDLRNAKDALRPIHQSLERQMPVAQQRASTGMKSLQNIMEAPNHLPVSIADADLSAIKAAARGADLPELRTLSQGLAARAVQELEAAVQQGVDQAGPAVGAARDTGRAETVAKYRAGTVLRDLPKEDVQAFGKLTYSADSGVGFLKQVAAEIPNEMPKVGRAYLQSIIEEAAKDGDINGATLLSRWQRLGPQTRATLFKDPKLVASIDGFVQRAATKSNIADVVGKLHTEPVRVFQRLTTSDDAALAFLKQVAQEVPGEMPKVGRAFLQGLFEEAAKSGEFTGSKSLTKRWEALGPETKAILYRNPRHRQDIGNLLRLAEMQSDNPNPSGTAKVSSLVSQGAALTDPTTGALVLIAPPILAKIMYSPKATRLLTQGFKIPLGNRAAATMAFQGLMAEIAKLDRDQERERKVQ